MAEVLEIKVHKGSLIEKPVAIGRHYIYHHDEFEVIDKTEVGILEKSDPEAHKFEKEIENLELQLFQLDAQKDSLSNKIKKDEILFGHPNPKDIAEKARLEFQISKIKVKIE